ncbi:3'-5' exonuclease [Pseudomonas phage hairong]|nr:3'-5' exonuclease [Pseudomonas phage hairong]
MKPLIIAVGDIETTGIKQEDGHRIIEIALSFWQYDQTIHTHHKIGKTYLQRVNPERAIDPGAEAVHKISLAMLRGSPKWKDVAPTVSELLSKVDVFVAHNADFDAPFIALELIRVKEPMPDFNVFCTMQNGRAATPMGKIPNLGELAYACGFDYDPDAAHSARYDTDLLAQCYWKGIQMKLFPRPTEL